MPAAVADLFVVLDSVTDPFSNGMKRAAADAEAESRRMSGALKMVAAAGVGLAVGIGAIAVKSIDMGAQFQSAMTRLSTQAGVAKNQLGYLSNGVLDLAGQVGQSPDSLAEALYHVESNAESMGITSAQALDIVKTAAEGAAVGGANLVDVTNAMTAAVASGIPGVQNMSEAMGVLNATVGAGDMTMQNLADAFGTGVLASVKGFGVTIQDVGAGLAVFGDNNIRGALAGNEFRMAIQALAKPVSTAGDALKKLGLTQTTLANDMERGGMKLALTDLVDRMNKAGIKADQQGQIITDAFGRKAGTGIDILIGQFDRTMSKYPKLTEGAHGFGAAWAQTKATIGQQFDDIRAGADALAIRLGTALIPQLSKLITEGQSALGQIESGFTGASLKAPKVDFKNSRLNQDQLSVNLQQPQTAFEKFGQTVHTALGDLETLGQKLEPIGRNFETFGMDVFQAGEKIVEAVTPTVALIGTGLFAAIDLAGKAAANILGPAIKDFANFLEAHQGMVKYFSEVILGGMILKMTILGAINAAQGVVNLATAIVSFPLSQTSQIGDAFTALKTAWTGKEAQQGEQAVQGLAGAFSNLKQAGSNALDKILPDSGKLATLAQLGTDATNLETAAEGAGTQLPAMAQGISSVEQEATTAEGATSSLAGTLGKFAMGAGIVGAVVGGLALVGTELGKMSGVGFHTTLTVQGLADALKLAASGSTQAQSSITTAATALVTIGNIMHMTTAQLTQIDQGLAQMVSDGHAEDAKNQFIEISAALAKQGISAADTAKDFPQYEQAVKNAGAAAQTMDGQVQGLQATLQQQQAVTQFNSDLQMLTQSIQTNGRVLSGNSQAALANQQAFFQAAGDVEQYFQQQRNANVPISKATQDMLGQVKQLEATGVQAGLTKGQVDQYLKTLGLVPSQLQTMITADTAPALDSLSALRRAVDNSIMTVTINGQAGVGVRGGAIATRGSGGPVTAHNTYLVGENGPEIVTFGASGYVTPNSMLQPAALAGPGASGFGGAAGTVVNYNYTIQVAGSVLAEKKLVDVVRTTVLQYNGRNSANGWSLPSS